MRRRFHKAESERDRELLDGTVEPLESRLMLAGSVEGVVRGRTLWLDGDDQANAIVISSSEAGVGVRGIGTSVALEGDLSRVMRIIYRSADGDDSTSLHDLSLPSIVSIHSTGGNVSVDLAGATQIGGRITSSSLVGNNDFFMTDTAVASRGVYQWSRSGDTSTIVENQAIVGGWLRTLTKDGASDVQIVDSAQVDWYRGSGVRSIRNVIYAERETGDLKADIYLPKTDGPHPAILAVHGGYWRFGSKASMTARARTMADRGYVVVNINYRLAPDHHMPDMIHDVKSAIRWMRNNAEEYGIDPDQIGTYGYSAGGQLALMLGVTDGSEGLEGPDADGTSSRVQAVVAGSPGTDFRTVDLQSHRFEYLFGGTREELTSEYAAASPSNWVSSDDAPTFIFRGTHDSVISQDNLDHFVDSLESAGVDHRVLDIVGGNHLSVRNDRMAMMESLKFLDEQLKA